jgi:hypothetical protein
MMEKMIWDNVSSSARSNFTNTVLRLKRGINAVKALKMLFPEGIANRDNFVMFSTGGVNGNYTTIEEYENVEDRNEREVGISFVIIQPRILLMRYGNVHPMLPEDYEYLKKLRQSSWEQMGNIGKG